MYYKSPFRNGFQPEDLRWEVKDRPFGIMGSSHLNLNFWCKILDKARRIKDCIKKHRDLSTYYIGPLAV